MQRFVALIVLATAVATAAGAQTEGGHAFLFVPDRMLADVADLDMRFGPSDVPGTYSIESIVNGFSDDPQLKELVESLTIIPMHIPTNVDLPFDPGVHEARLRIIVEVIEFLVFVRNEVCGEERTGECLDRIFNFIDHSDHPHDPAVDGSHEHMHLHAEHKHHHKH